MSGWADSDAQPYADHRLLWDTVAALLGESRAKGGPVTEQVTLAGQSMTITIDAAMPPNLAEHRGHGGPDGRR